MTSKGYALSRQELIRALTAYSGVTTSDGAADGTTLIDSALIGRNDFISEKTVLILSGDAKDEDKGALSFNSATGAITLRGTGISAQIVTGTIFRVLNISSVEVDVANIQEDLGDMADAATSDDMSDITTTSALAKLRLILNRMSPDAFSASIDGTARTALDSALAALGAMLLKQRALMFFGTCDTGMTGSLTEIYCAELAGFGDNFFNNKYYIYILHNVNSDGNSPEDELQQVQTYVSADGHFTMAAGFAANVEAGDVILLLHEFMVVIGWDSADNIINTSNVVADAAGSILERLEHLREELVAVGGLCYRGSITAGSSTTAHQIGDLNIGRIGNDFFSNQGEYYLAVISNADSPGGDPEGQIRKITDFVASTYTVTTDAFGTATAGGDEVIILHRSVLGLLQVPASPTDMTPEVPDNSILANVITSDGDTSGYDRATDSLEAIRDFLVALQGGTETLESLDNELDAMIDMAKVSTSLLCVVGTEHTLTALGLTNTTPMFISGIWLGMENALAGDVFRWRVFADWDDASIADQITDDEIWTFSGLKGGSPSGWVYMPLGFWVTYEIAVKVTQLDGTARTVYAVLDSGARGS